MHAARGCASERALLQAWPLPAVGASRPIFFASEQSAHGLWPCACAPWSDTSRGSIVQGRWCWPKVWAQPRGPICGGQTGGGRAPVGARPRCDGRQGEASDMVGGRGCRDGRRALRVEARSGGGGEEHDGVGRDARVASGRTHAGHVCMCAWIAVLVSSCADMPRNAFAVLRLRRRRMR